MAIDVERARRLFTIDEYVRMAESGILAHDERVELIDGEIVEMSPMGTPHVAFVVNLTHLLVHAVGDHARVSVQLPVRLPPRSMPEPDLAVLRPRSYRQTGPSDDDVLVMVEVADTSLRYDRMVKLRVYARAGVPEYWIVDANAETLEIYRSPRGDSYEERHTPSRDDRVAIPGLPDVSIAVSSIFA